MVMVMVSVVVPVVMVGPSFMAVTALMVQQGQHAEKAESGMCVDSHYLLS